MCCLFGMLDYGGNFTGRQKTALLSVLAAECEARGTDATGIAYNSGGSLHVYKRPVPAHKLNFRIPNDAVAVMGHTRMTTQGSEKKNYNNHPFLGQVGGKRFALAHNGVLHNDHILRRSQKLPQTKIQTDSYVAVQLIEKKKALDFDSLKYMAEHVEGSFTFTVLDEANNWYLVKGDNPMCLLHFPRYSLYLYASTDEILSKFLGKARLRMGKPVKIKADCGEILKVSPAGGITRAEFDTSSFLSGWPMRYGFYTGFSYQRRASREQKHLDEVKSVAASFGYTPENIDAILEQGFTLEDVEDFLYCGRL
ncbi:MAG: class II glutamine amidotransferase [Butyricicoccus sp.]|nr:class II glutamine amidotransferase [Butyricicoccus sp.]